MHTYEPHETKLANEIASTLNDWGAHQLYLQYARKHPESFLRNKLERAMSIPQSKIRKTRGALFTFLVEQAIRPREYDGEDDLDEDNDYEEREDRESW